MPDRARTQFAYAKLATANSTSGGQTLQVNGSASVGYMGSQLQLTPSSPSQGGSAFTTNAISLGNNGSFSTHFQFQLSNSGGIGDEDGAGADGIVFVVQTVSNNVGAAGGGIGYSGIPNSIGIEFDTFDNGEISGNHVGVDENGGLQDFSKYGTNPPASITGKSGTPGSITIATPAIWKCVGRCSRPGQPVPC